MPTDHWVRELGADWPFGTPPYGQIGKYGKPLVARYPFSQVQIHWKHFCQAARKEAEGDPTKARYWTPARFAQFFTTFGVPTHSVVRLPYQRQSADEADRKALIPLRGEAP